MCFLRFITVSFLFDIYLLVGIIYKMISIFRQYFKNIYSLYGVPELMAPATERENSERLYIRAQEHGAPEK